MISSVPVIPGSVISVAVTENSRVQKIAIPKGYHETGITFIDEYDNVYYYIEDEASEFGLTHGYWIDWRGREVKAPNENLVKSDPVTDEEAASFPSAYDSRDYGYITDVEYQVGGTCWAHTTMACIEAGAVKKGLADNSINLSEYQMLKYVANGYFRVLMILQMTDIRKNLQIELIREEILIGQGEHYLILPEQLTKTDILLMIQQVRL